MGSQASCFGKKQCPGEEDGRMEVLHKDCAGTTTGTLNVTGNLNNIFQTTTTVSEKPEDYSSARLDVKEMLKATYSNIQMPLIPWHQRLFLPIEKYFVHLQMEEYGFSQADSYRFVELKDIFAPVAGVQPYRILIEGNAGYGKSTLAMKLAFDWSRNVDYLSRFDFVFLFQLRSLTSQLEEAILEAGKVGDMSSSIVRAVVEEDPEKVLLILDGFDELPEEKIQQILPILESTMYPRMTVVLTSRKGFFPLIKPDSRHGEFANISWRKQISIRGIQYDQQSHFLKVCFPDCCELDLQRNLRRIVDLIPDLRQDIFECPLFLLLVILLADDESIVVPKTKTDLYKAIFNFVIKRSFYRDGMPQSGDIFSDGSKNITFHMELLKKFGKLCLHGIHAKSFTFTEEEILSSCGGDSRILKLGFTTKNISINKFFAQEHYELIHKSFQEFLAALYLFILYENGSKDEFASELCSLHQNWFKEESGQLVLPFLCGLLKNNAFAVFHALAAFSNMYHDIRPFEATLVECEASEELLSAVASFLPMRWTIPGFYEKWFSVSLVHSRILNYGAHLGHITTVEWDLAYDACLPKNFEIPCMTLVIEDLKCQLTQPTYTKITCHDLTFDFRYASPEVMINNWSSLMLLLKTHFKARKVSFKMGFNTEDLLPLLRNEVCSGILRTIPVSALICSIEEDKGAAEHLVAIKDIVGASQLEHLSLTFNVQDTPHINQAFNRMIHQVCHACSLRYLELCTLIDQPLEIHLLSFQRIKRWKSLKFTNSVILYEPSDIHNLQVTEVENLVLDSITNAPMLASALEFFRITKLACEDVVFLQFVLQYSENFGGYRSIRDLTLKMESVGSAECFVHLTRLEHLENLSLVIMSYEEDSLLSTVTSIVTACKSLKLKALNLYNVQRDNQFVHCILEDLFSSDKLKTRNCATNSTAAIFFLKEITIGYEKSLGRMRKFNIRNEKDNETNYLSLLYQLKNPLTRGQLQRLNIVFEKSVQNQQWLEKLIVIFPQNSHFVINVEYQDDECRYKYSVHYSVPPQ